MSMATPTYNPSTEPERSAQAHIRNLGRKLAWMQRLNAAKKKESQNHE